MPIFTFRLYDTSPAGIFSNAAGGRAAWTGPGSATGTAVINEPDDPATDSNGLILKDEYDGENATADVTVGSFSATGANVESEQSWLVLDTITGEQIRVVQFNVGEGQASFTLTSAPLVEGRVYETISFVGGVSEASGAAFNYADYNDGTVLGTAGDDVIDRDYTGDPNGDRVDNDDLMTSQTTQETFTWSDFTDGQNLAAGATQVNGDVSVTISSSLPTGSTFTAELTSANNANDGLFIPDGVDLDPDSSGRFYANGNAENTTLTIDFDSTDPGTSTEVHNVQFTMNDIDGVNNGTTANFQDIITIRAYDADGNEIDVNIEILGDDTLSGNTVTADVGANETESQAASSILVTISGPVERIVIDYDNGGDTQQAVFISDINYDAIASQGNADSIVAGAGNDSVFAGSDDDTVRGGTGNDTLDGGSGNDSLYGDAGQDSLLGGSGNDTLLGGTGSDFLDGGTGNDSLLGEGGSDTILTGAGNDTIDGGGGRDSIIATDGHGADVIIGGETGTDFDVVDASALTAPVLVDYTGLESGTIDDGTDILTFSQIEQLILTDFDDTVNAGDSNDWIIAGAGDDIVVDGAGNDTIDGGSGNDTIGSPIGTQSAGDDLLLGGSGADSIYFGNGADTVDGGADADFIYGLGPSFNNVVAGGETGDDRDTISWENEEDAADAAFVLFTGNEAGTATLGGQTTTFSEIETVHTTQANDTIDASATTVGVDVASFAGDDIFTGGSGNDRFAAGSGDDTIDGGAGADELSGGDDADTFVVTGTFGDDTIDGGEGGNDVDTIDLSGLSGPVTVIYTGDEAGTITDGTSTITFSGIERLILTDFDDVVDATLDGAGTDIDAGDGNDTVTGGTGDDSIFAGTGNDIVNGGDGIDTILGGTGSDTIAGGQGQDLLDGGDDQDLIVIEDAFGADTILGGEGGADADTVDFSALSTPVDVTYSADEAGTATEGTDTLVFSEIENFVLTAGDDTLNGAADSAGMAVDGAAGDDSLLGGAGDDSLLGGVGSDTLNGGAGNDTLEGGDDADLFSMTDGFGSDVIVGGEGGTDADTLTFEDVSDFVVVTYDGDESGSVTGTQGDLTFTEIESLVLTDGNDIADASADSAGVDIDGGAGSDTLTGGTGNDTLTGGDDADTFAVGDGFGNDIIVGGEGGTDSDTIDLSGLTGPVTVTYTGDEAGTITDGTNTITFSNIENLILTDFDDVVDATLDGAGINVVSGDGNDSILGGTGDDSIDAGAGNDTVDGGDGADTILGGEGTDSLSGAAGDDSISGGAGNDTLVGGAGADTMAGTAGNDDLLVGSGDVATGGGGDDTFLIDPANVGGGPITVTGGEDDETTGDTVDFNGLWDSGNTVFDNPSRGGNATLSDGTIVDFEEMEAVICFAGGTGIATPFGPRRVEDLVRGDMILTRDSGPQPLDWVGMKYGRAGEAMAPIRFDTGTIGNDAPLRVSPNHRMLIRGWRAQLLFGEEEILVPAKALVDGVTIVSEAPTMVTYFHLLTPNHEVLFAEGAEAETFLPALQGLDGVDVQDRARLFAARPDLRADLSVYGKTARPTQSTRLSKLLVA